MSHDPRVYAVESDSVGHSSTVSQSTPNYNPYGGKWALDSLDQRNKLLRNNTFTYTKTGLNVHAYIMDSGIMVTHPEFQGRASLDYSAVNGESPDGRYLVHGTAVASVVGGLNTGVAKDVRLHSIKVTNKHDDVYYSTMIRACNWVKKHGKKPAVVNCSFGAWYPWSINRPTRGAVQHAFERLISVGFTVVVAAGNEHRDADHDMPSGVGKAVTVGALEYTPNTSTPNTSMDMMAPFSNRGSEVDLFAPGRNVESAWFTGTGDARSTTYAADFFGTSAAAPLVAGVVAQYLQAYPTAKPADIQTWLKTNATSNRIAGSLYGSPNRVLFTDL